MSSFSNLPPVQVNVPVKPRRTAAQNFCAWLLVCALAIALAVCVTIVAAAGYVIMRLTWWGAEVLLRAVGV